jgi:hypothetical protein
VRLLERRATVEERPAIVHITQPATLGCQALSRGRSPVRFCSLFVCPATRCSLPADDATALASFNLGLPHIVERVLSLLAAPALVLMGLWTPVLGPLVLTNGELLAVPTLSGGLLLIALYAALAYIMAKLALHVFRRTV